MQRDMNKVDYIAGVVVMAAAGVPGIEGMVRRLELRSQPGPDDARAWAPPGRLREYLNREREQS